MNIRGCINKKCTSLKTDNGEVCFGRYLRGRKYAFVGGESAGLPCLSSDKQRLKGTNFTSTGYLGVIS